MAATPASANAAIRVMRVLLQFAISEDWITSNPAREIRLTNNSKKGKIWSREAVTYLVEAADAAEPCLTNGVGNAKTTSSHGAGTATQ